MWYSSNNPEKMNVLVTGGCGYIGYSLIHALEKRSNIKEIVVFDNLYKKNINFFTIGANLKKTKFVKGDLLNKFDLEKVIKDKDIIFHLAGHVDQPFSYKDNFRYEQINQYGTVVLYDLLREYPAKKVVFMSSAAVYGFHNILNEKQLPQPANYYGISKFEAEKYMQLLRDKSEVYILRSGNVFGYNPQVRTDSVINKFFFEALVYNKIFIFGKGDQKRPFIYLPALVDKIQDITFSAPAGIYNLAQGHSTPNELLNLLLQKIPELEFAYVDAGKEHHSLTMQSEKVIFKNSFKVSFHQALEEFAQQIKLPQPAIAK